MFPSLPRQDWIAFSLSLMIGIMAVCVAVVGKYDSLEQLPETFSGASSYLDIGIVWGNGRMPLANERPPGYPFVVGVCCKVVGEMALPYGMAFLQAMASLAMILICFFLGQRLGGGPWYGLVAAGLVAGDLSLLLEFLAARETWLYALGFLLLFAGFHRLRELPRLWLCGVLGAVAGALWLVRPTGFLVVGVGALVAMMCFYPKGKKTAIYGLGVWAIGCLVPLLVWTVYQSVYLDDVYLSGRSAKRTFYYSWHPALDGIYPIIDIDELDPFVQAQAEKWESEGVPLDEGFRREGFRFILESPGRTVSLFARKTAAFFLPLQFPFADGKPVYLGPEQGWSIQGLQRLPLMAVFFPLASLAGVMAFFLALMRLRSLPPEILFVVLVVLLTAGIHLLTFSETRYRQPFDPALAVLAVWVASQCCKKKPGDSD
jgi:hypothetical protein